MIPPKVIPKIERMFRRLEGWRYGSVAPVELEAAQTKEHFRTPPEDLKYGPAPIGSSWGRDWTTTWFRGTAEVPAECKGRRVYYRLLSNDEKLLFVGGSPYAGMDKFHNEVLLSSKAKGGENYELAIEAFAGHPIPGLAPSDYDGKTMTYHRICPEYPCPEPYNPLRASELVVERVETTGLYYDVWVLFETAQMLSEHDPRRAELLEGLNYAIDHIPYHFQSEDALEEAAAAAREDLAPLLKARNGTVAPEIGLVGHAHIDTAWLWPVKESIRKAARTFSTALRLMEEYPELTFMQSQPIHVEFIEEHYPELLAPIKKAYKSGAWQPNGGMWVESDTNVPSGESLIRQFLFGRKKTLGYFGYYGDTLWLPDVFGYSAALPQILKGCDIDHFVTAKLKANDTNPVPCDTFDWEGIDGTSVFAHLILSPGAYNEGVVPGPLQDRWNRVRKKEVTRTVLASVGFGDGGGGMTREWCENARRMQDLQGCPKCNFVDASEFLRKLNRRTAGNRPCWVGELYFEKHRGTYTSQAWLKRHNRKVEFMLRDAEFFATQAMLLGVPYPVEALEDAWKVVLTNQFHDIIPGSSIRIVHETAKKEYAEVSKQVRELRDQALKAIAQTLDTTPKGRGYAVANTLSWERENMVFIKGAQDRIVRDAAGEILPSQKVQRGQTAGLAVLVPAKPMSTAPIFLESGASDGESPFDYDGRKLDTPFYRVRFDDTGKITSLMDKTAHREIVQRGRRLNDFYTAEDVPIHNDAWDIDLFYRDKLAKEDRCLSREVVADGPLMISIRSRYHLGKQSILVQDMTFYARSRRIDFRTEVLWEETHTMLKVGFPVDILADSYRNEIQFGHVTRPTHTNTSYDQAKFEVCAHKWVDISEGNYGVALLNDCKYGHDSLDKMISLTLLKSSWAPDERADRGRHEFVYALLPHEGDFSAETVVHEAYNLNVPLVVAPLPRGSVEGIPAAGFCSVSNPNVILDTVKKAEEDNAVVLRLYEAGKTRGQATLEFERPLAEVNECNMLEKHERSVRFKEKTVTVAFRPFEVKTLKVRFSR